MHVLDLGVRGYYPRFLEQVVVKLLAKKDGGSRPIMLFRCIFRVHRKARKGLVTKWDKEVASGKAQQRTRSNNRDSIYRAAIRHALASRKPGRSTGNYHVLEILWVFLKAFDKVDSSRAWSEGRRRSYPLVSSRLNMESYTWNRTVTTEGGLATG